MQRQQSFAAGESVGLLKNPFSKPPPPLDPGEEVRWKRRVNYSFQDGAINALLYVTDRNLILVPTGGSRGTRSTAGAGFDGLGGRWVHAEPQRIPLARVTGVRLQPPDGTRYTGGRAERAAIDIDNGAETLLFPVVDCPQLVDELRQVLGRE